MSTQQICVFVVDNVYYGINIFEIQELIKPIPLFKMPNMPEYFDGLAEYREKIMSVLNLRKFFGLAPYQTNKTSGLDDEENLSTSAKIIVVQKNNSFVGFVVDEVSAIYKIENPTTDNFDDSEKKYIRQYCDGYISFEDKKINMIKLDRIFTKSQSIETEKEAFLVQV